MCLACLLCVLVHGDVRHRLCHVARFHGRRTTEDIHHRAPEGAWIDPAATESLCVRSDAVPPVPTGQLTAFSTHPSPPLVCRLVMAVWFISERTHVDRRWPAVVVLARDRLIPLTPSSVGALPVCPLTDRPRRGPWDGLPDTALGGGGEAGGVRQVTTSTRRY